MSVAGDGIFTVALAIETLRIDRHAFALATVLAARLVPTVLLLLLGGAAGAGLLACLIGAVAGAWQAALLYGLASAGLMYGNALWTPLMQRLVPRELLGRASSVDWLVSISPTPVGVLAAGALATTIGVRTTILVGGAIATLAGLVLIVPGVRDPDCRASAPAGRM